LGKATTLFLQLTNSLILIPPPGMFGEVRIMFLGVGGEPLFWLCVSPQKCGRPLDKAAAKERRSVAGLAEFPIALWLEREGYLPKQPKSK